MTLSLKQAEFLTSNGLSVTEESGTFTLHYPNHECSGLSEPEINHILDEYISGKYCSYKPVVKVFISSMARDD